MNTQTGHTGIGMLFLISFIIFMVQNLNESKNINLSDKNVYFFTKIICFRHKWKRILDVVCWIFLHNKKDALHNFEYI